jgi:hypothetical protein
MPASAINHHTQQKLRLGRRPYGQLENRRGTYTRRPPPSSAIQNRGPSIVDCSAMQRMTAAAAIVYRR